MFVRHVPWLISSCTGSCHRSIAAHSEAVTGVAYNRDGSILASCSYDGLIRLWDTSTGQCLKTLVHGEAPPIGHVTFSPNAFQLLATSLDGTIRLWDMANGRVLKTYVGHQNSRFALKAAFTAWNVPTTSAHRPPCSVVAGSEDQRVYVWDLQNKAVIQTLLGHRDTVLCIAVRFYLLCRISLTRVFQTHERLPIIASASLDRDPCIKVRVRVSTVICAHQIIIGMASCRDKLECFFCCTIMHYVIYMRKILDTVIRHLYICVLSYEIVENGSCTQSYDGRCEDTATESLSDALCLNIHTHMTLYGMLKSGTATSTRAGSV